MSNVDMTVEQRIKVVSIFEEFISGQLTASQLEFIAEFLIKDILASYKISLEDKDLDKFVKLITTKDSNLLQNIVADHLGFI